MNDLDTQKPETSNLETPEKIISKEIINGYLFKDKLCSLWEEVIEINELDCEKLEPIYNFRNDERCSNSSSHQSVAYQDESGVWKANCCIDPKKVKYYKKKCVYYLTDYQPSKFKVKFLRLPIDNDNIDFSELTPVNLADWKKQLHWLVEKLTSNQLVFGSEEIKKIFFQEYNELVSKE